jgi:ArsR family transcriptional regulator
MTMIEPVQFFKCLSDGTRLHATLLIFAEGELCVCELMEALNDSQPKISRHLAQLRQCGILADARRGQWVFYSVAKNLPAWASEILVSGSKASENALATFQTNLTAMKDRPQCC